MLPQIIKTTIPALLALSATGQCVASRPDTIAGITTTYSCEIVAIDASALRESLPDSISPVMAPTAKPGRISLYALPYVLHPYAGAVYFMSARGAGFNFWRSLLYSACISNIGWEFGIEAFMERPSYQDLFITPLAGALVGELFYKLKRNIVSHDYRLGGSRLLGNVVAFLIDPVNEVVGLFDGNEARRMHFGAKPRVTSSLMPTFVGGRPGFAFTCTF